MNRFIVVNIATILIAATINISSFAQEIHSVGKASSHELLKSSSDIKDRGLSDVSLSLLSYGCYLDIASSTNKFASISLPTGFPFTDIGQGFGETLIQGSDFGPVGILYAVSSPNILVRINLTTGTRSTVATITGTTGTITSLAYNEVTHQMYLGSTNTLESRLYNLNISTGAATLIGSISNCPVLITLAINCSGLAYGIDISADVLLSINLINAAGTVIGQLGFNANYAQDADFDPDDGTLYFASYNPGISSAELRTVDLTTGAATLVSNLGARQITAYSVSGACFRNNDLSAGPFKQFPSEFVINNPYAVRSAVKNPGILNQTDFPVKFIVNGIELGMQNLSLNSGQEDSVSFMWTPVSTGNYNLRVVTALASDENRNNDTVSSNVQVFGSSAQILFSDNFSGGVSNWTIVNSGGNCNWQTYSPPYPNPYTLPPTSAGEVLAADSDECGSGTSVHSTASQTNNVDCSGKENVYLSWDNDWRHLPTGIARVEVSYDGGSNWSIVVEWSGISRRNTTEVFQLQGAVNNPNVKVRFVSVQPEWSWWWIIDNVRITGNDIILNTNQTSSLNPKMLTLYQNYPNPFNPSTVIAFETPAPGFVELKVYDIRGKEMATLVNEYKAAGMHSIEFNGGKEFQDYSSGIYFYKLKTQNSTITKRMTILK